MQRGKNLVAKLSLSVALLGLLGSAVDQFAYDPTRILHKGQDFIVCRGACTR